ncbi:MAG: DoxX family protein [Flavobacterium sp.]|nr:DoxX family protein [Pedobacter sp.]
MKKTIIIYWVSTIIIFLFEGVMPAFTFQTELAKEGIRHLGYPAYFGNLLVIFKMAGSLILVLTQMPKRVKEWAYAGFTFDFIFASASHGVVDGIANFQTFLPLILLVILVISYVSYHKKFDYHKSVTSYNYLDRASAIG